MSDPRDHRGASRRGERTSPLEWIVVVVIAVLVVAGEYTLVIGREEAKAAHHASAAQSSVDRVASPAAHAPASS
jgi:hypothetical protein